MKVAFLNPSLSPGQSGARSLRGVAAEFGERGHHAEVLEPARLRASADLTVALGDPDLVVVHESCSPALVERVGDHRRRDDGFRLLFHATDPAAATAAPGLGSYDGILAGNETIRQGYLQAGWEERVWTWREAADTRIFHPLPAIEPDADVVLIGGWGDATRAAALRELLIHPARQLRLRGVTHGPPPPRSARLRLRLTGIHHCSPVAEEAIPELFARHRLTVQIPSYPAAISPFEALACGIPLISAPGGDADEPFLPERDYLVARDRAEMREAMQAVLELPEFAAQLSQSGLESIQAGHTCDHRAQELLAIDADLSGTAPLEVAG